MHLSWKLLRFQNELDLDRPESKVIKVRLNIEQLPDKEVSSTEGDAAAPSPWGGERGDASKEPAAEASSREDLGASSAAENLEDGAEQGMEHVRPKSASPIPRVSIAYEAHAEEDDKPFMVEPVEKVRV